MQRARAHGRAFSLLLLLTAIPGRGADSQSAASRLVGAQDTGGQQALQLATQLLQEGRLDQAEAQARLALSDPACAPVAYAVLGALRLQQKKYPDSISFLERALRLEPRLVGARLNLAQACELANRNAEALVA
jgi:Tfp pilus assembly protein PilF